MYIKAKNYYAVGCHMMVNTNVCRKISKIINRYVRAKNNTHLTQRQRRRSQKKATSALFILLGSLTTFSVAYGQAADVVFLIDGSGSIDSNDWDIQKAGIANAISDTTRFDATTAITVIQWSSTAQVELNRVLLDSAARRVEAADSIRGLIQLRGATDPAVGIDTAVATLANVLDPSLNQILCLSTDGEPQSEVRPSVDNANAAGFDRLSVIGIEDLPGFDSDTARSEYGPVVFGGGTVTIARNAADFANLVGSSCLNPAANLVAIEVNQSVQSWNNDIPLVAGKETVVRVFVETNDGSSFESPGQLFGTRNGVPLAGSPLAPDNPNGEVEISANVVERRNEREASLNFELPPEWTEGPVELRFELPGGVNCANALPFNSCNMDISFETARDITVRVIPIEYPDESGVLVRPTDEELLEQVSRIDSAFPVANVVADIGNVIAFKSQPTSRQVIDQLQRMHTAECSGLGACVDTYFSGIALGDALVVDGNEVYSLSNSTPGAVSTVNTQNESQNPTAAGYFRNLLVHEVGYSLGLEHAVVSTEMPVGPLDAGRTVGLCGEIGSIDAEVFPDVNTVTLSDGSTADRPTLGPLGDEATEVWGFDSRYIRTAPNLAVIDPSVTMPLMSHCRNDSTGQGRWISRFNYTNLLEAQQSSPPVGQPMVDVESEWDALFVNGIIDLDAESVEFGSADVLPGQLIDFASTGPARLTVFDVDDNVIEEVNIEPVAVNTEVAPGGGEQNLASFYFPIRLSDDPIRRVELDYDGVVFGEQVASANSPTANIDFPTGSVVVDSADITIRWSANDEDGDPLFTSVYYSGDGVKWRTLGVQLTDSSLTVPRSQLAASQSGRLAIAVSDGLNTSRAFSDFFIVDNNAPEVTITSPGSDSEFSGVQTVIFKAAVKDRDEQLSDDNISWSTDLNDAIGTGRTLSLIASDLIEGDHVVTAAVTDSSGLTSTASVDITIERIESGDDDVEVGPGKPAALTGLVYSTTAGEIFWQRADASEFVVMYDIYRDGALVETRDGTSYFDDTLTPGSQHVFYIEAIDSEGNRSVQSDTVRLETMPGQLGPERPTGVPSKPEGISGIMYSTTAGEIFWSRADISEAVVSYDIFRNDVLVASLDALSYFDDTLVDGDTYTYYIVAVNVNGDRSEPSGQVMMVTTPPNG